MALLRACCTPEPPSERSADGSPQASDTDSDESAEHLLALARAAGALLAALLTHHTGAAELRALLLALRAPSQPGSLAALSMLEALETAALPPPPGPRSRFDFAGPGAAIDLGDAADPFPDDGISFWMWLRLEPASAAVTGPNAPPMSLVSLLYPGAGGCELALEPSGGGNGRALWVRSVSGGRGGGAESVSVPLPLQPGRWHSLCVALERRTVLRDRLCVWLDGEAMGDGLVLRYPSVKAPAPAGGNQASPDDDADDAAPAAGAYTGVAACALGAAAQGRGAFAGQIAGFAMFAAAATAREAEALHAATRGAHAALEPALAALPGGAATPAAPPLPPRLCGGGGRGRRGGGDSKLLLALDARAAERPAQGDGRAWSSGGDATAYLSRPHTRPVVTATFAEALAAAGGPAILLPLFAFPSAPGKQDALPLAAGGAGLGPAEFAAALSLLASALEDDACRAAFAAGDVALRSLAALLAAAPGGTHLTPGALAGARRCVAALAPHPRLHAEAAARLLFDLRLWAGAPSEVRAAHLCALSEWVPRHGLAAAAAPLVQPPRLAARHVLRGLAAHAASRHAALTPSSTSAASMLTTTSIKSEPDREAALGLLQQLMACDAAAVGDVLAALTWSAAARGEASDAAAAAAHAAAAAAAASPLAGPTPPVSPRGAAPEALSAATAPVAPQAAHQSQALVPPAPAMPPPPVGMPDAAMADALDALLAVAERQLGAPGGPSPGPAAQALASCGAGEAAALCLLERCGDEALRAGALRLAHLSLVAAAHVAAAAAETSEADTFSDSGADGPGASAAGASEPLCAAARAEQGAALAAALGAQPLTLRVWDSACPLLLEGVAGAPARQPPGDASRRPSQGAMALASSASGAAGGTTSSPRGSVDAAPPAPGGGAAAAAAAAARAAHVPADAFVGGFVPPRGGGAAAGRPAGAPPPRRLPAWTHGARLAAPAAPLLVPALLALRGAPMTVRIAALKDLHALLLAAAPPAAAASRALLSAQPGWAEALLALAMWPPGEDWEREREVAATPADPSSSTSGASDPASSSSTAAAASIAPAHDAPPPGALAAAAAALARDRVLPACAPDLEDDVAASLIRAAGADALLAAMRSPGAPPSRRAAAAAALAGAYPEAGPVIAHELAIELAAAVAASNLARAGPAAAFAAAGVFAPLEALRAAVEAAGAEARASRAERRDVALLLLLRVTAHARAALDGVWAEEEPPAAVAGADGFAAAEATFDPAAAPPLPPPPRVAPAAAWAALAPAAEANLRSSLLLLGCLAGDEIAAAGDGGGVLAEALACAARWVWRASAPPLPKAPAMAPVWMDDARAPECGHCGAALRGVAAAGRRHHCRLCGGVFCGDCSAHKAPLPEAPLMQRATQAPQRLCAPCAAGAAPLQTDLRTGLLPGGVRAAPAFQALRSLLTELAVRAGAPPARDAPAALAAAAAAVIAWLARASLMPPAAAAAAASAVAAAAGGDVAAAAAAAQAAAEEAGAVSASVSSLRVSSTSAATSAVAPSPFVTIEAGGGGDARVARQHLMRWALMRLFGILSEALTWRDAASAEAALALASAAEPGAPQRALPPLTWQWEERVAALSLLTAWLARHTDASDDAYAGAGAIGGDESDSGAASGAGAAPGDVHAIANALFHRSFAPLQKPDAELQAMLRDAASLGASDAARALLGAAFAAVRSNAWGAAARTARAVRNARARRLALEGAYSAAAAEASRTAAAAAARVAGGATLAAVVRAAAAGAEDEASLLRGPPLSWDDGASAGPLGAAAAAAASPAAALAAARRELRRTGASPGPWALRRAELPEGRAFWRLSEREDGSRARRLLKRNTRGSGHAAAAHASTARDAARHAAATEGALRLDGVRARSSMTMDAPDEEEAEEAEDSAAAELDQDTMHVHDSSSAGALATPPAVPTTLAAAFTPARLSPFPSWPPPASAGGHEPRTPRGAFGVGASPATPAPAPGVVLIRRVVLEPMPYPTPGPTSARRGASLNGPMMASVRRMASFTEDGVDDDDGPQSQEALVAALVARAVAAAVFAHGGAQSAMRRTRSSGAGDAQRLSAAASRRTRSASGDDPVFGADATQPPGGSGPRPLAAELAGGEASFRLPRGSTALQVGPAWEDDAVRVERGDGGSDGDDESDSEGDGSDADADGDVARVDGSAPAPQRRGLLRRFRAGAATFAQGVGSNLGGAVADATARVRLATGEAITAIRDDVTAAADAAARVATNRLALGGLLRGGSNAASNAGSAGLGGAGAGAGAAGNAAGAGLGAGFAAVTFAAPAEVIRPTRVWPGTILVSRAAVEWVPDPAAQNRCATEPPPPSAPVPPPPHRAAEPPAEAGDAAAAAAQPTTDATVPAPPADDASSAAASPAPLPPAPDAAAPEARPRRWPLDAIVAIYPRRFLLRRRALELFLSNGKSVLLHLPDEGGGSAEALQRAILAERPPRLVTSPLFAQPLPPRRLLRRARWTARWQAGELSNYEYLMLLNTAAGRSFNDLQQYPVFPWVLADYESPVLDLSDPASYRDLSKPVGALNAARLAAFVDRFHSLEDNPALPRFHYGTHYSSLGTVLFFLLRLAPFTTAALALQEGRVDHADRLFHDVAEAWRNACTASADVKELIPEFYSQPDFLRNAAQLPLGRRQDGAPVGDVALPPWAGGSAEAFIRLHRAALESEHVSQHLHLWIDLIFGCKQRGAAAEAAHNVFYFLTYEGAVDIDAIADPVERAAVEAQIALFGQCPSQLFTVPHPPRAPGASRRGAAPPPPAPLPPPGARLPPPLRALPHDGPHAAALYFHPADPTSLTVLDAEGGVRTLRWDGVRDGDSGGDGGEGAADGASNIAASVVLEERAKRIGGSRPFLPGAQPAGCAAGVAAAAAGGFVPPAASRAALVPASGGALLAAGHFGGLLWLVSPDEAAPLQAVPYPGGALPLVVAVSEDGCVAAAGASDGSIALWRLGGGTASSATSAAPGVALEASRGALAGESRSRRAGRRDKAALLLDSGAGGPSAKGAMPAVRLTGHAAPVTAVAVSAALGLVLSGAADGTCLLHSARDGRPVRGVRVPPSAADADGADALLRPAERADTDAADDSAVISAVAAVAIGPEGELVVHALGSPRHLLCVYSANGTPMAAMQLRAPLHTLSVSPCGRWLLAAGAEEVGVYALHTLEPALTAAPPRDAGAVTCAALSPCGRALLVGTKEGGTLAYVVDALLSTKA